MSVTITRDDPVTVSETTKDTDNSDGDDRKYSVEEGLEQDFEESQQQWG